MTSKCGSHSSTKDCQTSIIGMVDLLTIIRTTRFGLKKKGTLRNDQKEFKSNLCASPFVVSKKHTIMVLGYYSMRKMNMKTEHASQPMKEKPPCPQNQSEGNSKPERDPNGAKRYMQGVDKQSICNGQNGMNPINHACLLSSLPLNPNLNGMSSHPNGIGPALKKVDEESQKSEESRKGPDTLGVSKPHDIPSETSPSQPNEASPSHVPNRVSKNILQGCILPSWTRRSRPPTLTKIPPT